MMAMRGFTTVAGGDLPFTALVRSVYEIPERGARRLTEDAVQAVLEANPHLEGLDRVPVGTPIVVPELPEIPRARRDDATAGAEPVETLLEQAAGALRQARAALETAHDRRVDEVKETVAIVRSRPFRAAVGDHEAGRRAESMVEGADAEIEEADASRREQASVLDALEVDLEAFAKVVRGL
jgi:hypothetical protein